MQIISTLSLLCNDVSVCLPAQLLYPCPGIPKPLLGHCVISQGMRPIWPPAMRTGSSSTSSSSEAGAADGAGGGTAAAVPAAGTGPWAGLVSLTERCWAQDPQARWGRGSSTTQAACTLFASHFVATIPLCGSICRGSCPAPTAALLLGSSPLLPIPPPPTHPPNSHHWLCACRPTFCEVVQQLSRLLRDAASSQGGGSSSTAAAAARAAPTAAAGGSSSACQSRLATPGLQTPDAAAGSLIASGDSPAVSRAVSSSAAAQNPAGTGAVTLNPAGVGGAAQNPEGPLPSPTGARGWFSGLFGDRHEAAGGSSAGGSEGGPAAAPVNQADNAAL